MGQMRRVSKNNTQIVSGEHMAVILHGTAVVSWDKNTISLNSGGWRTVTTKARMNQASNEYGLGYTVWQDRGEWYVNYKGNIVPFEDNMTFER